MHKLPKPIIGMLIAVTACLILSLSWLPVARAQQGLPQAPASGTDASVPVLAAPTAAPVDTVPPLIAQPADIFVAAHDGSGAIGTFLLPAADDESGKPSTVGCNWAPGSLFPVGQTLVTCTAMDAAGNAASVSFLITVTDQTAPVIPAMTNIVVDATDPAGSVVAYHAPVAWDNVTGAIVAGCNPASGAFFPVGTTLVTCYATDVAGNHAAPGAFYVTVNAPVVAPTTVPDPTTAPTLTSVPTEDGVPVVEPAFEATEEVTPQPTESSTPGSSEGVDVTSTGMVAPEVTPSAASPLPTATLPPTVGPTTVSAEPVPDALNLPWPPPGNFIINTYGGPLNGIDAIWGYESYPVSQEFGHTEFSIRHSAWYTYGIALGLDGYEHPGLDVGMPAGTWLYSPVEGTVRTSGDTPYFTYYGNGAANVGELRIVTDEGHEVILGHIGAISVSVGERVEVGQFVGVSGGFNGDHLHLEVLEAQWGGWHRAVDPRKSFIVDVLEEAAKVREPEPTVDAVLTGLTGWQRPPHVGRMLLASEPPA